ncbi:hypothetical protein P1X14_13565 [Sphingomonas sp. AOB5]|uniref:hypothetical protein n=1 Tax=Sphingomonas sp. AOB5 TaxID=3034017 RepID=UPI0023F98876|nr:hypothetical protein [Sphingomonas sp. AOB5]MDF7776279.1 hypothetical protein [Sphingomonas sp. AOB5]
MNISQGRYYQRRYAEELAACRRAVTPEAAARRGALVISFADKLKGLGIAPTPPMPPATETRRWILELE